MDILKHADKNAADLVELIDAEADGRRLAYSEEEARLAKKTGAKGWASVGVVWVLLSIALLFTQAFSLAYLILLFMGLLITAASTAVVIERNKELNYIRGKIARLA
ncbi:hypothetical protein [Agrobacterium pusense]|uniref:hypothetical protein n=1 Tax=Agrobacterium pusense TaxID=648995 RepID=UPI00384EDF37